MIPAHTKMWIIYILKSVREAHEIDDENKNSLWRYTITQEMPKIMRSVQQHEDTEKELEDQSFKVITGHMSRALL